MSEEILEAFKRLKSQLDVRDYDDERFIKDLPENEPVSLVIPFERTGRGYLDIFRSYIGGDEHPELSDEELLEQYLESPEGKEHRVRGDIYIYNHPNYFKAYIEEYESGAYGLQADQGNRQRNRFSAEEVTKLIQTLKKQGINAVSKQDEKSQDPSTIVVMDNGIMTPFMNKKTVDSLMPIIKKAMSSCGFAVGGHIAPVTFEQLRSPLETEKTPEDIEFLHNFIQNFSKQPSIQPSEIEGLSQLTTSDKKIKVTDPKEWSSIIEENNKLGRPYVWRGGVLGDKPFIANINTESEEAHVLRKSWAMATPSIEYALRYASFGKEPLMGTYRPGFLYQYRTSGKETYFKDRGLERQPSTFVVPGGEELPLFPNEQPLENIFFYCATFGNWGKTDYSLMRLDPNNPDHQKLLKLYEPQEEKLTGNLLHRRINQFNEASANDGHPNAYTPTIQEPEKTHHLKGIMARLSRRGAREGKGMVRVDVSLKTNGNSGQIRPKLNSGVEM